MLPGNVRMEERKELVMGRERDQFPTNMQVLAVDDDLVWCASRFLTPSCDAARIMPVATHEHFCYQEGATNHHHRQAVAILDSGFRPAAACSPPRTASATSQGGAATAPDKIHIIQLGGQLLEQLVSQRADISERMIITLEELEKATNNFEWSRKLGGGEAMV